MSFPNLLNPTNDPRVARQLSDTLSGVPEAALTVASAIPAMAKGGVDAMMLAGMEPERRPMGIMIDGRWEPSVVGNVPMPLNAAVERSMESMTFAPRSQAGQEAVQGMGSFIDTLMAPATAATDAAIMAGVQRDLPAPAIALPLTFLTAALESLPTGRAQTAARAASSVELPPSGFGGVGAMDAPGTTPAVLRGSTSTELSLDDLQQMMEPERQISTDPNVTQAAEALQAGDPLPARDPSLVDRDFLGVDMRSDADVARQMDQPIGSGLDKVDSYLSDYDDKVTSFFRGGRQRGSVEDTGGGQAVLGAQASRAALLEGKEYSSRFKTIKEFNDWRKATPNTDPQKRQVMYEVLREQRAKVDAGRKERDGRPYGAPIGMSPQRRTAMVKKYADRIERGIDTFGPGYFYQEGRDTIRSLTPDVADQRRTANQIQATSSQVGPAENVNYTIRGRDQFEGGAPISTTIYPNTARQALDPISEGREVFSGYKVDRYGNLLTPEGARPNDLPPEALMPPNDRWEFRAAGFNDVPGDPKNVAYMDKFREDALSIVNRRRAERGEQPLNLEQAQELHWAVIRAESEGRPLTLNPSNDQIGGAMNRLEFAHTFEAEPGTTVGQTVAREGQQGLLDVFNREGRDPLVESMGGLLQRPVQQQIGYWDDQVNLGQRSTSFTSRTDSGGIDPSSAQRVRATEAVRALALGQDAFAGHVFTPISAAKNPKYNGVSVAAEVGENELRTAIEVAGEINPDMIVVHSPGVGVRAWIPGDTSKKAQNQLQDFANELPFGGQAAYGKVDSMYDELPWQTGQATEQVVRILDETDAAGFPGLLEKADSPETREVLGAIATKYDELQAADLAVPNEKLVSVLKTWAKDGLSGVREMVKKGTAPAAALAVLSGQQDEASEQL